MCALHLHALREIVIDSTRHTSSVHGTGQVDIGERQLMPRPLEIFQRFPSREVGEVARPAGGGIVSCCEP